MNRKSGKTGLRTYVLYAVFGAAVTFAATMLIFWILQEIAGIIPMSIFIGVLVGLAFKLFSDSINREQMKRK